MTYTPGEADVEVQRLLDLKNFCKHPYINGDEDDFAHTTIINMAENQLFSAVADADLEEWCHVPRWTIDQATALFFGKDPEVFRWSPLRKFTGMHRRIRQCSLMRKRLTAEIFGPIIAIKFQRILKWSRENDFRFPDKLYSLMESDEVEEIKAKGEDEFWDRLDPRERNTIKKLLIVIAVEGFGYNSITQKFRNLDRLNGIAEVMLEDTLSSEASRSMLRKLSSSVSLNAQGVMRVLQNRQGKKASAGAATSAKPIRRGPPEKTG